MFSPPAHADAEALQASLTVVLDDVQGYKEKIAKAQSLKQTIEQRAKQAKKYVDDAKSTYNKGKQIYSSAKEKARAIKGGVEATIAAVQEKDLEGLGYTVLSPLKGKFDGKMSDNEAADAVVDVMVRKKGADSIANQMALSYALNKQNAEDMSALFSKTMVLRQNIRGEEDEIVNVESIDEAIDLSQKASLRSMKRNLKIIEMKASMAGFEHMMGIHNLERGYDSEE